MQIQAKRKESEQLLWDLGQFALQCRDAWRLGEDALLPPAPAGGFQQILLMGMGGSAIGGDLTKFYAQTRCPIPVEICKNYDPPCWVGSQTLAIAISHSGNTEETICCYAQCQKAGAVCIAITGGGRLAALA